MSNNVTPDLLALLYAKYEKTYNRWVMDLTRSNKTWIKYLKCARNYNCALKGLESNIK